MGGERTAAVSIVRVTDEMTHKIRITLFGGQGSNSLFSNRTTTAAVENLNSSTIAALLLSRCHSAFLGEFLRARTTQAPSVIEELAQLANAADLLNPPSALHSNPIIQGSTLCLHQLLEHVARIVPGNRAVSGTLTDQTDEAVGFCSGILPAAVVSSAESAEQYLTYSVHAIRLAFWIGYRVAEFCEQERGRRWRDEGPWAVVLMKKDIDLVWLRERVTAFNRSEHTPSSASHINISSVNGPSSVSVAGPPPSLRNFQKFVGEGCSFEPLPVHGLYHGGEWALPILHKVLEDCRRYVISFPTFEQLKSPLRLAATGELIGAEFGRQDDGIELLETALRSILIDPVNWHSCWKNITQRGDESNANVEVRVRGPVSRSLFPVPRPTDASFGKVTVQILGLSEHEPVENNAPQSFSCEDGVAIVGMSVNFPIGSDKDAFWASLRDGLDSVREISSSRVEISTHLGKSTLTPPRYGNFLEKPWSLDHQFFNISPREVKSMDPQQRLLLQAAVHALDDAGYSPDSTPTFQRSSMGCYVGVATNDYVDNLRNDIDVYYSTGTLRAFLSGKLSYAFKFSGPSIVVDTACSSSTVAIYQACTALKNGDCSSALAGGVNSITSADMYQGLSRAHFLSPTGQCKAFDADADGYCRAEGCGLFVLKRLRDAISENDRIYGVIRGIEVNQCGNAHSITHPHQETQQALFRQLLSKSHISASTVGVIEAHGTGTVAGDAAEISSLQAVFGQAPGSKPPLYITSVKSNTGHAEAASGVAGLAKLLLMFREKSIPPQVNLHTLNPRLSDMGSYNFAIATQLKPWKTIQHVPRRALLNNFGAAGSNAALVVEEFIGRITEDSQPRTSYPFIISARTALVAARLRERYLKRLKGCQVPSIQNLCYTATARRQRYEYRISMVCRTSENLCTKLDQHDASAILRRSPDKHPIVFVFSGQGATHLGMGKELLNTSPLFRKIVLQCDGFLRNLGMETIIPMIDGSQTQTPDSYLGNIIVSQCACFVVEHALAQLWRSWNIIPDLVIGHSLGEYAAFVQAGVISLQDMLRIVAARAALMVHNCLPKVTTMLACSLQPSDIEAVINSEDRYNSLSIACHNSLRDCVISGRLDQIESFREYCTSNGFKCKVLDVPYGFHSDAMDCILTPLAQLCSHAKLSSPKIPIGSNYHGRMLQPDDISPQYFVDQMRNTVRFSEMLQAIPASDLSFATFIEIGPAAITLPMIKTTLPDQHHTFLSSLNPKQSPWTVLSTSLALMDTKQDNVNWRVFFDGSGGKVIDVPEYPLESTELLIPFDTKNNNVHSVLKRNGQSPPQPLGLQEAVTVTQDTSLYKTTLSSLSRYIKGHVVRGTAICPASVYYQLVLEAAMLATQPTAESILTMEDICFDQPLVYESPSDAKKVGVYLKMRVPETKTGSTFGSFEVGSLKAEGLVRDEMYCKGKIISQSVSQLKYVFTRKAAMIRRQRLHLDRLEGADCDIFTTRLLYETVFPRVVEYSKDYQTILRLTTLENGSEGFGSFKLPVGSEAQGCILSPAFTDTLLHAAGFVANCHVPTTQVCICVKVESIKVLYQDFNQQQTFSLYCSLFDSVEGGIVADAYAKTESGDVIAAIEGMHFKRLQLKSFEAHLARQKSSGKSTSPSEQIRVSGHQRALNSHHHKVGVSDALNQGHRQEIKNSMETTVLKLVAEVCEVPMEAIGWNSRLRELGLESLALIELAYAINQLFPELEIDHSTLMASDSIGDIQSRILAIAEVQDPKVPEHQPPYPLGNPQRFDRDIHMRRKSVTSKISKARPKLRAEFAHTNNMSAIFDSPLNSPTTNVKAVIHDVCGIPVSDLQPDTTLESLGIDSLLAIELSLAINELGIEVPQSSLSSHLTLEDLAALMSPGCVSQSPISKTSASNMKSHMALDKDAALTILQTWPGRAIPLYLFHDGSGTIGMYSKIRNLERQVFGAANPKLNSQQHWAISLIEMATHYASVIAATSSEDIILGGWSFGGVLAYEVARQLEGMNRAVKGLVMIDSPYPRNHEPLPDPIIQHILQPFITSATASEPKSASAVSAQFRTHAKFLSQYQAERIEANQALRYVMLLSQETMNTSQLCGVKYAWLEDKDAHVQSVRDWEGLVGHRIEVLDIPGNHFEPFTAPYVDSVSVQLRRACDMISSA